MINKSKVVNSHFKLGVSFYDFTIPAQFPNHILRFRNDRAAKLIDLDYLDDNQWIEYFGKFVKFPGIKHKPLALKYNVSYVAWGRKGEKKKKEGRRKKEKKEEKRKEL